MYHPLVEVAVREAKPQTFAAAYRVAIWAETLYRDVPAENLKYPCENLGEELMSESSPCVVVRGK